MFNDITFNGQNWNGYGPIGQFVPNVNTDQLASVNVSTYKWLTTTLSTAQNGTAYQPYFNCYIVDDTTVPNAIINDSIGVPLNGSSTTAPDGSVWSVGNDGTGALCIWQTTNPALGIGTKTTLDASYQSQFNAAISISNWINGTYVIDVYAFTTLSINFTVYHNRSVNGGLTWSTSITPQAIGIATGSSQNMYIAAGQPIWQSNGIISASFFYIKNITSPTSALASYKIFYQTYTGASTGNFNADTEWNQNADSGDWVMNSLDTIYYNGFQYVVFAGYNTLISTVPNDNYGLYVTRFNPTGGINDWTVPITILNSTAINTNNLNSFTYPKLSIVNGVFYLLYNAVVVIGVTTTPSGTGGSSQNSQATTQTYYYLSSSVDMMNFSYPSPLLYSDGTVFNPSTGGAYSYVQCGSYVYTIGNGYNLWQWLINYTVANITNSVISYEIDESYESAFLLTIVLANQNNQWIGPSPTMSGAAAIAQNKKIYLEQGYITSLGIGEVAPRNIFYIDTITQSVTSNTNDVQIVGRDLNKQLIVTTSRFAFSGNGPISYVDNFNGTTFTNWNVVTGTWFESSNAMQCNTGTGDNVITLSNFLNNTESSIVVVGATVPPVSDYPSSTIYTAVYPIYIDSNNFFRVKFGYPSAGGGELVIISEVYVAGSQHTICTSYNTPITGQTHFPVMIRKSNYTFFEILIGNGDSGDGINGPGIFDPTAYSSSSTYYPCTANANNPTDTVIDISEYFSAGEAVISGSVGLGTNGVAGLFDYFKFLQFNPSQSIDETVRWMGAICGIQKFNKRLAFSDNIFLQSNYQGTFTTPKGIMMVAPNQTVMNIPYQFMNGDIMFSGVTAFPVVSGNNYGIQFIFSANSSSPATYYSVDIVTNPVSGMTVARFYIYLTGQPQPSMLLAQNSIYGYRNNGTGQPSGLTTNSIPFNLAQPHEYKLVVSNQTFMLFIDKRCVMMWQDNNNVNNGINFSQGYWGIQTNSNSNVYISAITSSLMWNQIQNVAINPGDQMSTDAANTVQINNGWIVSDLMGRLNSLILQSTDQNTFTYNSLLYAQEGESSGTQYVNQVTVYGNNGISAVAADNVSIATTGFTRDMDITDYTILTYADALTRATLELQQAEMFNLQNTPTNPNNVGSEIFDVVTVTNTGNNSTGATGTTRVYNETITNDGSKGRYAVQLEAGLVS